MARSPCPYRSSPSRRTNRRGSGSCTRCSRGTRTRWWASRTCPPCMPGRPRSDRPHSRAAPSRRSSDPASRSAPRCRPAPPRTRSEPRSRSRRPHRTSRSGRSRTPSPHGTHRRGSTRPRRDRTPPQAACRSLPDTGGRCSTPRWSGTRCPGARSRHHRRSPSRRSSPRAPSRRRRRRAPRSRGRTHSVALPSRCRDPDSTPRRRRRRRASRVYRAPRSASPA